MSDNDKWIEVTITTSHEAVEAVSAKLYDLGVAGVAIEDPKDIIESNTNPKEWDYVEERLLPEDTGEAKVKGYFIYTNNLEYIISNIKSSVDRLEEFGLKKGKGEVTTKEVKEQDWANTWKQYYKPFRIGDHIVIKPTWEDYLEKEDDIVIELDPGMAFGTGDHETTKMCILLLSEYVKKNSNVFDIGCGSGILSIAASKLGAENVIGVDIDDVAVKAARENVSISGLNNIDIRKGNLTDVIEGKADVIVANIIADAIINLCKDVPKLLKKDGVFIASGIIKDRLQDVEDVLSKNGFDIVKNMEMGEWAAIAAVVKE
jgi:ribosomal protein L11 methyltransferase